MRTNKLLDPNFRRGDLEGMKGIEKIFDKELRGNNGLKLRIANAKGDSKSFDEEKHDMPAKKGLNIITTLDIELQKYGESLMQKKRGAIVVINPNNGKILSLILLMYIPNKKEHLEKWYPYLKKYGLLIVELHSIDPQKTQQTLGKNSMTAYDATHGYSDQYIIEYDNFLEEAKNAGLKPEKKHEHLFPSKEIPIVSVNRLICE